MSTVVQITNIALHDHIQADEFCLYLYIPMCYYIQYTIIQSNTSPFYYLISDQEPDLRSDNKKEMLD
jgi:hypothetical protein